MKLRPPHFALLLLCGSIFAPALAQADPDIAINTGSVWVSKGPGVDTQGFMEIHNTGDTQDILTGWSCTVAASTRLVDAAGKPLTSLIIPAGQTVTLSTTGPHILLQTLRYKVDMGAVLPCAFSFAQTGDLIGYLNAVAAPAK